MSGITSFQRKLIYFGGIVLLSIPIILLGMPAGKPAESKPGQRVSAQDIGGGHLAKLRHEYDLGESNLGKVDPTSSTMNLVLVGLRGFAANQLWLEANRNQERKQWAELESNVDSIILLQPHFAKVWEFHGWNLAYNVAAEWDLVEDKYYWIKRGAKFSIRGTDRNSTSAELFWWVGIILGDRISRHDAWTYMRKFFNPDDYPESDERRGDPDIKRLTGKVDRDKDLNRDGLDNYLVAKKWFHDANDVDNNHRQRRMTSIAFRQRPAKSQMAYADMLQKEGRFHESERMATAWVIGHKDWVDRYEEKNRPGVGQELVPTNHGIVRLEATTLRELEALTRLDKPAGRFTVDEKRQSIAAMRGIIHYNYWKVRSLVEGRPETVAAHRLAYEGQQLMDKNELLRSAELFEQSLAKYADMLIAYPSLITEDETSEDVAIALIGWRRANMLYHSVKGGRTVAWETALPWSIRDRDPKNRKRYQFLVKLMSLHPGKIMEILQRRAAQRAQ